MATAVVLLALILNVGYFKEDIWYRVEDSHFLTGEEWNMQRRASVGDFWPDFGHKVPDKFATGEYINYFPGWNREPNSNGLILAKGAAFKNTPVRTIGNIISLVSLATLIVLCKRKH